MSKWIPTSEKLPPASDDNDHACDVLLWVPKAEFQGGHPYLGHLRKTRMPDDQKGERNFWRIPTKGTKWTVWGWSHFEELPEPTHWMPLPDAPDWSDGE